MPDTAQGYMDAAKSKLNLKSDRALAQAMPTQQKHVSMWRTGVSLPEDEKMRRLAELAGLDQREALIWLNIWRASSLEVAELYRSFLEAPDNCDVKITARRIRSRATLEPESETSGAKPFQGSLFGVISRRVGRLVRSTRAESVDLAGELPA